MINRFSRLSIILFSIVLLCACALSQPVLYPNEHAKEVGDQQVRQDIDECLQLAKDSGAKSNGAGEVAKGTAGSATEGAATGAATGAVTGNPGTAAAVGAINRGLSRFFSGMKRSNEPSPAFKQIVERCLVDKGYEPVGWK
ncbi:MAG: hypothetical protein ACR2PU_00215 [Gammaproteobacteria bacterium]